MKNLLPFWLLMVLFFSVSSITKAQLNEGFEGATFPPTGWTIYNGGDSYTWEQTTSYYHTGTHGAYIHWGSTAHEDYMITPQQTISASNYMFSFWAYSYSSSFIEHFNVKLSTTGNTAPGDFTVTLASDIAAPTTWTQFVYDLTPYMGQNVYLAVEAISTDMFYLVIDDFLMTAPVIPNCAVISAPLNGATGVSAHPSLSWTDGGGMPTGYYLYLGTDGGGTVTPTSVVNGTAVTSPYVVTTALDYSTTYYWQIVPFNGAGSPTGCSINSFTTMADPTVSTFPWEEGFEVSVPPPGWTYTTLSGTATWTQVSTGTSPTCSPYEGGYMAKFNSFSASTGDIRLGTPPLDISSLATPVLKFYMYGDPGYTPMKDYVILQISTDGAVWSDVQTIDRYNTTAGWYQHTIDLSPYLGQTIYIGFLGHSGYGNNIYLDKVRVLEAPTVPVFGVNPTTKNFGMVTVGNTSAAQVFTISNAGGGTLTLDPAIAITGPDASEFVLTDANTYPVNLLLEQSTTVSVAFAPTGGGTKTAQLEIYDNLTDQTHIIPLTGDGYLGYLVPPFTEPFNDAYTTFPPLDWTRFIGLLASPSSLTTTTSGWTYDDFANVVTSPVNYSARLNIWSTSTNYWLMTPSIDLGDGSQAWQLVFDLAYTTYSGTGATTMGPDDKFAVVISTDNGTTWSNANVLRMWTDANPISGTGEQVKISLIGYTGMVKIAFYGESTVSNVDNNVYVDNVSVIAKVPQVLGTVTYANSAATPMQNTTVNLMDLGGNPISSQNTAADGSYLFYNPAYGNYKLGATTSLEPGGVNSGDALRVLKHFTGMITLTGAQLAAADVTTDLAVNSNDALAIQKKFINMLPTGFTAPDWYIDEVNLTVAGPEDQVFNLKAICFGDVNSSFTPPTVKAAPSVTLAANGTLNTQFGNSLELPLITTGTLNAGAISLILNYPSDLVEVTGVRLAVNSDNFAYTASNGELRISWFNLAPVTFSSGTPVLYIQVKARSLSDIEFTLNGSSEFADANAEVIPQVNLILPKLTATGTPSDYSISNYPNPFHGATSILYTLPASGNVNLTVYNAVGAAVATLVNEAKDAGSYQVRFDASNYPSGVYYYTLKVNNYISTNRMVVSE